MFGDAMINKILTTSLAIILAVASCSPHKSDVRQEYSDTTLKLGITPVYPPSEEVQVGDVYALSIGKGANDILKVWIGEDTRAPKLANEYLQSRTAFNATTYGKAKDDTDQPYAQIDFDGEAPARRIDQSIKTLPVSGFPTVIADSASVLTAGQASFWGALGLSFGTESFVRLDFGDVRSHGFPKLFFAQKYGDTFRDHTWATFLGTTSDNKSNSFPELVDSALRTETKRAEAAGDDVTAWEDRCLAIMTVTQVYLTRRIKYTFLSGTSGGAVGLGAVRVPDSSLAKDATVTGRDLTRSGDPREAAQSAESIDLTSSLESLIASSKIESIKLGAERGTNLGSLSFTGYDSSGAVFEQTFARPVVVGFDGWIDYVTTPNNNTDEETCEHAPV